MAVYLLTAAVFAVFYGAYDTVAGIATGIVLRNGAWVLRRRTSSRL